MLQKISKCIEHMKIGVIAYYFRCKLGNGVFNYMFKVNNRTLEQGVKHVQS